jgi:amino acid transporter
MSNQHETPPSDPLAYQPHLERRFGLLQATALNMSNMVGVGPFITIPILMTALVGPQSLLGWAVALVITWCDALVWSELGAAMPGSGGSYVYLREGFGRDRWGRLMAFLFIWQFIFSGPLEIASGYIGFAEYLRYVWTGMGPWTTVAVALAVGLLNVALLYRRIGSIGRITVSLWIGTSLTMLVVILTGIAHFDPKIAFDFPTPLFPSAADHPWGFSFGLLVGLGAASRIGVYDYLGYYDVCYIGDEVRHPGRTIPWSIIISLTVVAVCYFAINLSVIGVVPWREFVPKSDGNPVSSFIVSIFMERVYGRGWAIIFTLMVLWTTLASVFALLLGYSRIPYAAAKDGGFFRVFSRLHPTKDFPHYSLLMVGGASLVACFFSLEIVISTLVTTRILIQFIGQAAAVIRLRRVAPEMNRPFRIWLYPLPVVVALIGWSFIFITSGWQVLLFSLGVGAVGIVAYFIWARISEHWPFVPRERVY